MVDFGGKGKYSPPEFTWKQTIGITALKFLNSDKLGNQYQNTIFVGDINNGNIYHFDLNKNRTSLLLNGSLADKIADTVGERNKVVFANGFAGITDIEVGPYDGYLYIVTFHKTQGSIYRIVPHTTMSKTSGKSLDATSKTTKKYTLLRYCQSLNIHQGMICYKVNLHSELFYDILNQIFVL